MNALSDGIVQRQSSEEVTDPAQVNTTSTTQRRELASVPTDSPTRSSGGLSRRLLTLRSFHNGLAGDKGLTACVVTNDCRFWTGEIDERGYGTSVDVPAIVQSDEDVEVMREFATADEFYRKTSRYWREAIDVNIDPNSKKQSDTLWARLKALDETIGESSATAASRGQSLELSECLQLAHRMTPWSAMRADRLHTAVNSGQHVWLCDRKDVTSQAVLDYGVCHFPDTTVKWPIVGKSSIKLSNAFGIQQSMRDLAKRVRQLETPS